MRCCYVLFGATLWCGETAKVKPVGVPRSILVVKHDLVSIFFRYVLILHIHCGLSTVRHGVLTARRRILAVPESKPSSTASLSTGSVLFCARSTAPASLLLRCCSPEQSFPRCSSVLFVCAAAQRCCVAAVLSPLVRLSSIKA